jgi:hypothetical protein
MKEEQSNKDKSRNYKSRNSSEMVEIKDIKNKESK